MILVCGFSKMILIASIHFLPFRFQFITVKKVAYVWMTRYYSIIMPFKKVDFSNYDLWQCVLFESLRDCYLACCGIESFLGLRVIQETTILQNTWCFKLLYIPKNIHNSLDTYIVSVFLFNMYMFSSILNYPYFLLTLNVCLVAAKISTHMPRNISMRQIYNNLAVW